MSIEPAPRDVERRLRRVSQLRLLFRRLPHVATPAECRLLEAYQAFRDGRCEDVTLAALRVGVRDDWRAQRLASILQVSRRLSSAAIALDRDIVTYFTMARLRLESPGK